MAIYLQHNYVLIVCLVSPAHCEHRAMEGGGDTAHSGHAIFPRFCCHCVQSLLSDLRPWPVIDADNLYHIIMQLVPCGM